MNLERVIAVRTNETVYRGGDQCVKVFGDGFTKADALGEALNQARVEECGLHVPKVLEVSQVDGKWALVTEYVEGKTLERLIAEEPGRKEKLLERMTELQVEMISKSCPLLSRLREDGFRVVTAAYDQNNPRSGRVLEKLGMRYIRSYEEQWQPKDFKVTFLLYQIDF